MMSEIVEDETPKRFASAGMVAGWPGGKTTSIPPKLLMACSRSHLMCMTWLSVSRLLAAMLFSFRLVLPEFSNHVADVFHFLAHAMVGQSHLLLVSDVIKSI